MAWAQAYPTRPITMNVPYAAGGPLDVMARVIADGLRGVLGQTIVIENVAGAGGAIGAARAARAAPDGYTVSAGNWSSHVATGAIYTLPFDPLKDLEAVTMLPSEPNLIIARKDFPANTLGELIAWLKKNPDKASAGTSGIGGPSYMAAAFFQARTGTRFQLVPYRGAGPAMLDLVASQLDIMLTGPAIALPHVRDGSIKVYAVHRQGPHRGGARHSDHRRNGVGRLLLLGMVRAVGAEGNAQRDHRQAQRCDARGAGGSDGTTTPRRALLRNSPARDARTGTARAIAQGRGRKMVADHQGGRNQTGMMF
jgi:hypothetical protein